MVTKTTTRPSPRTSHSHSASLSQSQPRTSSRPSTTPLSPSSRIPPSVGQALPPTSLLRSPGAHISVRTPSPNYFGGYHESTGDPRDSGVGAKDNWSPPTSSIQSFGGASPKHIPLESNPSFEAFRRQTDEGKNPFNLGHGNLAHFASTPGAHMPRPERPARPDSNQHPTRPLGRDATPDRMDLDGEKSPGNTSAFQDRSSLGGPSFFDIPRQESPANISSPNPTTQRNALSHLDDRHPRLSLPGNRADPPSPHVRLQQRGQHHRAETLPSTLEEGPAMLSPPKLRDILERLSASQFLLIDLRVSNYFAVSRIQGALNLCIPTTLLKRPSFNLQKLQDTLASDSEKEKFAKWKTAEVIVVYDAKASEKKDALSAVNTLKKFATEGYKGSSFILRNGFAEFSKMFPHLVDHKSTQDIQSSKISLSLGTSPPQGAPVAGGCVMPATKNALNPFFNNIRQNQDLIGGVGLMDVKLPAGMSQDLQKVLPAWLSEAAATEDHGHKVANKFTHVEQNEKSRMIKAYQSGVQYGTQVADANNIQIAGVEKGGKNRYNDIFPFEHSRVKIQGRSEGDCDYINASHIKASRSNKRYIASQGPMPATFEDFWNVIWDEDVRVIVMLTAEKEGGQLKCHSYWSNQEHGPLKLRNLSEKKVSLNPRNHRSPSDRRDSGRRRANTTAETAPRAQSPEQPHVIIRKFTLSHSAHPFSPMREITQVHYSSWPDFGAPASAGQLLSLVELSNSMQRSASAPTQSSRSGEPELEPTPRPILVHCSAGCGRTGTFCTIDSVIDMLKRQRKEIKSGVTPMEIVPRKADGDYMGKGKAKVATVDGDWIFNQDLDLIEHTVEDFRRQRISMVQSLRQYVLCYEAVIEWIAQQSNDTSKSGRDRSGSDGGAVERASRGS
ncbi:Tyrosine-protein phosphatase [Lachnellula suecica]|uniref:protein-tyrosine-phosphatase n=1 Tax=Lachnellula suecica TaxID=602035 RepID=A0A8T9CHT5_9HELO|nr:Tyrosine-protein phosphatase [Lachnellula suecica]